MPQLPGKLVLIDDDELERELLEETLSEKEWEISIEHFSNAHEALNYLKTTSDAIFLLICDMNMPKINGLTLKKMIDDDPQISQKALPFIFLSTSATRDQIRAAYSYRVQGYFRKTQSIEEQAEMLDIIIRYWIVNQHPNIEDLPKV